MKPMPPTALTRRKAGGPTFKPSVLAACLFGLAALLGGAPGSFAQAPKPMPPASAAAAARPHASSGPEWSQLTPAQQQALAPLAASWNTGMSEQHKRKWLEISKNYSRLTPEEQATINSRMNEWAALSPQQRAQARLNFGKTKELSRQLTPEEKKAKWEAYQALSPEEKQKLAAIAAPKPKGAATALKPVAPQKLAAVPLQPASRPALKPAPKMIPSFPAALPASGTAP